jgi:hypothetical protein
MAHTGEKPRCSVLDRESENRRRSGLTEEIKFVRIEDTEIYKTAKALGILDNTELEREEGPLTRYLKDRMERENK